MPSNSLIIEIRSSYAILTINRPDYLNALNADVFYALDQFFGKEYLDFTSLRGVIITGAGEKAFVAGADIKELQKLNAQSAASLVARGHRIFDRIEQFHLPVVAAVNGFALGGGCELAMACHLRVANPRARFGLPELGLGLIPGYGGTQRLIQYLGKGKALELMLTGDFMDAREALERGLVNRLEEKDSVINASILLLDTISKKGPRAVKEAIACVNAYFNTGLDGFSVEKEIFAEIATSTEAKEGLDAFLEKRKPDFRKDKSD